MATYETLENATSFRAAGTILSTKSEKNGNIAQEQMKRGDAGDLDI